MSYENVKSLFLLIFYEIVDFYGETNLYQKTDGNSKVFFWFSILILNLFTCQINIMDKRRCTRNIEHREISVYMNCVIIPFIVVFVNIQPRR